MNPSSSYRSQTSGDDDDDDDDNSSITNNRKEIPSARSWSRNCFFLSFFRCFLFFFLSYGIFLPLVFLFVNCWLKWSCQTSFQLQLVCSIFFLSFAKSRKKISERKWSYMHARTHCFLVLLWWMIVSIEFSSSQCRLAMFLSLFLFVFFLFNSGFGEICDACFYDNEISIQNFYRRKIK